MAYELYTLKHLCSYWVLKSRHHFQFYKLIHVPIYGEDAAEGAPGVLVGVTKSIIDF